MKRILVSLTLALALLGVFAGAAGASPKVIGPKVTECSAFRQVMGGPWQGFTDLYGHSGGSFRVRIEQEYTPGGANCNQWRVVGDISAGASNVTTSLDWSFCRSSGCGYFDNWLNSYTIPAGYIYSFPGYWTDLTTVATGCVWSGRAMVNNNTVAVYTSSYICV